MRESVHSEKLAAMPLYALADLMRAVAASDDLQRILDATMGFMQGGQPQHACILALHANPGGPPQVGQLLAEWTAEPAPRPAYPAELRLLSDFPLGSAWEGPLTEPVFLSDIGSAPHVDKTLRAQALAAGYQAAALLPLCLESQSDWQGILKIFWAQPHDFLAAEQALCKIVMTTLATHIGGLAARKRFSSMLADTELLHHVGRQLNVAGTSDQALQALLQPAPAREEAEVFLCAIDSDDHGQPAWLTVVSHMCPPGSQAVSQVGARYHVPEIPFAKLYFSSPDAPLLITDVTTDPRVDSYARTLYAHNGVRATIIIALTMHDRWVGLLNFTWRRPLVFSEREQYIYQALAKHAALRLDHTMIVERLRASLEETRRQEALLTTVLDNVPVGIVLLEAPSGRPILSNSAAARVLGRPIDPQLSKEKYPQTYGFVRPDSEQEYPTEELPGMRAISTGVMQTAEFDVLLPDGGRRSLEGIGVPMHDANGTVKKVVAVLSDVTVRKSAEQERRRLQDEALRIQAAALLERSSPLIPITDDILVLPIIGSIDTERGHQVLDTVLAGAGQSHARVAIIDITGVRALDTQAAAVLTHAAQALRLLGVIPVLTGIKAEVAQTLVSLGVGLENIVTRSTLQAGIQYALRQLGKSRLE